MSPSSDCELSPQGRAFSTVLTAFIGSIINGLTSGYFVAFITGWISWLAALRILSGALITLYQAFSPKYTQVSTTDDAIPLVEQGPGPENVTGGAKNKNYLLPKNRRKRDITVLGWIGWAYTAIYSPIVHILWIAANWSAASGQLKLVRGLGVSVAALGLTIDTKKRYAENLGGIAGVIFKLIHGGSAFGMGAMCVALLIKGAIDMNLKWYFMLVYCIFCVIWAAVSFSVVPVEDGGIKGFGIIPDVLMGVFAGVFLAAPAFIVMRKAEQPTLDTGSFDFTTPESGSASLHDYLSCESVPVWRKVAAVLP